MKLTKVFFDEIRELIVTARTTVARGVDLVQVYTNCEIGRRIVLQEQKGKNRAAYGEELLVVLAARLSEEFGKGFSRSNIAYMRSFYLAYQHRGQIIQTASGLLPRLTSPVGGTLFQIVQTLSGQFSKSFSLSLSHYVFLLGIKNLDERNFYEIEANSRYCPVQEKARGPRKNNLTQRCQHPCA